MGLKGVKVGASAYKTPRLRKTWSVDRTEEEASGELREPLSPSGGGDSAPPASARAVPVLMVSIKITDSKKRSEKFRSWKDASRTKGKSDCGRGFDKRTDGNIRFMT